MEEEQQHAGDWSTETILGNVRDLLERIPFVSGGQTVVHSGGMISCSMRSFDAQKAVVEISGLDSSVGGKALSDALDDLGTASDFGVTEDTVGTITVFRPEGGGGLVPVPSVQTDAIAQEGQTSSAHAQAHASSSPKAMGKITMLIILLVLLIAVGVKFAEVDWLDAGPVVGPTIGRILQQVFGWSDGAQHAVQPPAPPTPPSPPPSPSPPVQ